MKIGWCKCLQEIVLIYFVVPFSLCKCILCKIFAFYAHSGITNTSDGSTPTHFGWASDPWIPRGKGLAPRDSKSVISSGLLGSSCAIKYPTVLNLPAYKIASSTVCLIFYNRMMTIAILCMRAVCANLFVQLSCSYRSDVDLGIYCSWRNFICLKA